MYKSKTWQAQAITQERQERIQRRIDAMKDLLETANENELYQMDGITQEAMGKLFKVVHGQ